MVWTQLGQGTFNTAYYNEEKTWVFKVQRKNQTDPNTFDAPARSVRLWNELNAHIEPKAELFHAPELNADGWICPYVEGGQSNDHEMAQAVLDIFNRTGRIIVDAYSKGNFVTTPKGEVVCIDVGMALQLEQREDPPLVEGRERAKSFTSLNAWQRTGDAYQKIFKGLEQKTTQKKPYGETTQMIKALLFIKSYRPDIYDVSFLKNGSPCLKEDPTLLIELAAAADISNDDEIKMLSDRIDELRTKKTKALPVQEQAVLTPKVKDLLQVIQQAKADLKTVVPGSFKHYQASCICHLDHYIQSRGTLGNGRGFQPSWKTKLFRDRFLTAQKVEIAEQVIDKISEETTIAGLKRIIQDAQTDPASVQSKWGSGLAGTFSECAKIIDLGEAELLAQQKKTTVIDDKKAVLAKEVPVEDEFVDIPLTPPPAPAADDEEDDEARPRAAP